MFRRLRPLAWGLLILSLVIVFWLTLFDRGAVEREIYWIPLSTLQGMWMQRGPAFTIYQVLGNLTLFVPLGLLLPIVCRIRPWQTVLLGAGLSLFIEITQYIFALGVTDVNDLILNTLGSLIGTLLYQLSKKVAS